MKNNKFYIKIAIGLTAVLFLAACEQKQLERDSISNTQKDKTTLNENNYINQAKYHYARYSQIKEEIKEGNENPKSTTRAHPGAKLSRDNDENSMSVTARSISENIDTLLLNQNGVEVKILLDRQSESVTI